MDLACILVYTGINVICVILSQQQPREENNSIMKKLLGLSLTGLINGVKNQILY